MWLIFSFLVLCLSGAIPKAGVRAAEPPRVVSKFSAKGCGTGPPSDALRQSHIQLAQEEILLPRETSYNQKIMVDTVFNTVSTTDQAKAVTSAMVMTQLAQLNSAYSLANIQFRLVSTIYTVNNAWATGSNDAGMKNALRQGTYNTLNVYFQTNLSSADMSPGSILLGFCSLPTNVTYGSPPTEFPQADYAFDGCNILAGTMPNGSVSGYNQGKTAVHEVGHWFGLLHTFQDTTCSSSDPGDYIDDTPQEGSATNGCPTGKDSCPNSTGVDPINNYMDYSTDACYTQFTPKQRIRMQQMWKKYRANL